jgi:hypothetical protein
MNSFLISWAIIEFSVGDWTFEWLKSCAHARLLLNVSVSLYKLRKCVFVLQVLSKTSASMFFTSCIIVLAVDGRSAAQQLYLLIRSNKEHSPNASRFRKLVPYYMCVKVAFNDVCIVSRKLWAWLRQRCLPTLVFGFIIYTCKQTPQIVDQYVFFNIGCAFQAKDSFIYSVSKMCLFFFLITIECRNIKINVQVVQQPVSDNRSNRSSATSGSCNTVPDALADPWPKSKTN